MTLVCVRSSMANHYAWPADAAEASPLWRSEGEWSQSRTMLGAGPPSAQPASAELLLACTSFWAGRSPGSDQFIKGDDTGKPQGLAVSPLWFPGLFNPYKSRGWFAILHVAPALKDTRFAKSGSYPAGFSACVLPRCHLQSRPVEKPPWVAPPCPQQPSGSVHRTAWKKGTSSCWPFWRMRTEWRGLCWGEHARLWA